MQTNLQWSYVFVNVTTFVTPQITFVTYIFRICELNCVCDLRVFSHICELCFMDQYVQIKDTRSILGHPQLSSQTPSVVIFPPRTKLLQLLLLQSYSYYINY